MEIQTLETDGETEALPGGSPQAVGDASLEHLELWRRSVSASAL
jgi:hypothetical protein